MTGTALAAMLAGTFLVLATLVDAFEVMLLPRRVRRRMRFVRFYFRVTWGAWSRVCCTLLPERLRPAWLGVYGPLAMMGLIALWVVALVTGFGLVQWSLVRTALGHESPSLGNQLYFSGVTFLTLGYGDVTAPTGVGKLLSVAEAAIGFAVLAVVVGYLPVLYQLFSQRETHVIRLDARAGSPPTAAELLARHAVSRQGLAALDTLLQSWEEWSAQLLESHLSYPMLGYYRSQHDNESWLAALCTVLDASALLAAGVRMEHAESGNPNTQADDALPRFQARMTFAIGRLTVVEMARALHGDVSADAVGLDDASLHHDGVLPAAPVTGASVDEATTTADTVTHAGHDLPIDRLTVAARARLAARLREVGLVLDADTWARLDDARRSYEPFVIALAGRLHLAVPQWSPIGEATDNWARSVGGAEAKVLLETAEAAEAGRAEG